MSQEKWKRKDKDKARQLQFLKTYIEKRLGAGFPWPAFSSAPLSAITDLLLHVSSGGPVAGSHDEGFLLNWPLVY